MSTGTTIPPSTLPTHLPHLSCSPHYAPQHHRTISYDPNHLPSPPRPSTPAAPSNAHYSESSRVAAAPIPDTNASVHPSMHATPPPPLSSLQGPCLISFMINPSLRQGRLSPKPPASPSPPP
ncbi:hypothetical protein B0T18DRAFT_79113 [Schizothecium vesticola]|uniref:Uncharacterized protein n=1 Tax=Schizothecium vesticola TaxID=314040 RepID=A0AA40F6S1_9PEZI|nr:hypothetical protein B0T18DRAFT_79113 [Schizothecium vesticola]